MTTETKPVHLRRLSYETTGGCPVCGEPAYAYAITTNEGYVDACPTHARQVVADALETLEVSPSVHSGA